MSDASTHSKKDYAWVAVYVKEEKDGDVSYGALCDDKPYKRFCLVRMRQNMCFMMKQRKKQSQ